MRNKALIYLVISVFIIVILAPFFMLFGPARLKDYLHKELVYKVITSKVTRGLKTDEQKALKLMEYVHRHVVTNQAGYKIIDKHPFNDLIRNVGVCDQVANTLITLARKAHIKGRLIFLRGYQESSRHSVCDLYIDGEFRVFDPTFEMVFIKRGGDIATFKDIQQQHAALKRVVQTESARMLDPFGRGIEKFYFKLFEPAYGPKIFRTNFEQDIRRFILSRWIDLYYDAFGDSFLTLYQELYFRTAGTGLFLRARYKQLSFRHESAIADYDYILENRREEFICSECVYFKAVAFWELKEHHKAVTEFERLLKEFSGTKRRRLAMMFLLDSYSYLGNPDRVRFYLSRLRPGR